MNTEFSRQRFDSWNDFGSVLMQQGRVQLDADWNEFNEIIDRRLRAETVDILGRGIVPKQTPEGFNPSFDPGSKKLTIGPGRMYVDGLLAENHGKAPAGQPLDFDPALSELRGSSAIGYEEQPYYPNPAALPTSAGPNLIYLDVWHRELTNIEMPGLVEPAVGVDTTTRIQTAWQVRVLENAQGVNLSCSTPDDQIPGWLDIITPSAGRLTTAATGVPSLDDPCLVPPTGGYRSLENRCYRIEIHSVDPNTGAAAFKWARDNRSMTAAIISIPAANQIVLDRVQWDSLLRFSAGDWVEITDDWREFAGRPGIIAKISAPVEDSTRTITLSVNLSAADFPLNAQNQPDPARHTRIRKWDQSGIVRDSNGNVVKDLNADNSGVIPLKTDGTSILIEDGIQITFSLAVIASGPSRFRPGDYWVFAARAADASIEILTAAPPRGVHHHYCRLGLLTSTGATDCRQLWPPDFGGECCACTVCVTPHSHANNTMTLQQAIDKAKETGGTVCVAPGTYALTATLQVSGARSIRIKGQGWQTILAYAPAQEGNVISMPAILVQDTQDFVLEDLALTISGLTGSGQPMLALLNSKEISVNHCLFVGARAELFNPSSVSAGAATNALIGIGLGGTLQNIRVYQSYFLTAIGVSDWTEPKKAAGKRGASAIVNRLITTGLWIRNNTFQCALQGVSFQGMSAHLGSSEIAGNVILGCSQNGIIATGVVDSKVYSGSHFDVARNSLRVSGDGIVIGVSEARISSNDIGGQASGQPATAGGTAVAGIALAPGVAKLQLSRCQIIGNRITQVAGNGIEIRGPVASVMIKQNIIENILGGGIVMDADSSATLLTIENNQILNVGSGAASAGATNTPQLAVGVYLLRTDHAEVANNAIGQVGTSAVASNYAFGVLLIGCAKIKVTGNRIVGIGPPTSPLRLVGGVFIAGSFENLDLAENNIRRANQPFSSITPDNSNWFALLVGGYEKANFMQLGDALLLLSDQTHFILGNQSASSISVQPEVTTVRGNTVEAYGVVAPVRIVVSGACVFGDNVCRFSPAGEQPVVELAAGAIAFNSNYIENAGQEAVTGAASPIAARLSTGPAAYTALGNVSRGVILVNNQPLGPSVPLNVTLP